jgi:hypothetical protein
MWAAIKYQDTILVRTKQQQNSQIYDMKAKSYEQGSQV